MANDRMEKKKRVRLAKRITMWLIITQFMPAIGMIAVIGYKDKSLWEGYLLGMKFNSVVGIFIAFVLIVIWSMSDDDGKLRFFKSDNDRL